MFPSVFRVDITGPDDNLIEITWKEEEHLPDLPDEDLAHAFLAMSNYSGVCFFKTIGQFFALFFDLAGAKEISFMLQGCKVKRSLPHQLSNIFGSTYQLNFPLEQTWGAVNPQRSNLTIDPSVGHARRKILQEDDDCMLLS